MNATRAKSGAEDRPAEDARDAELVALRAEIERLAERLRAVDAATLERAREIAGDLSAEWRRIEADVAEATRSSPWRSLGVAALIGLALGLIWRR
jgi:ElaB/YqjD/DUF883 family membrane-anchored ribosome-binding protein